jgi:hypothetical protein
MTPEMIIDPVRRASDTLHRMPGDASKITHFHTIAFSPFERLSPAL